MNADNVVIGDANVGPPIFVGSNGEKGMSSFWPNFKDKLLFFKPSMSLRLVLLDAILVPEQDVKGSAIFFSLGCLLFVFKYFSRGGLIS